jgi:predicted dehydrogenase
MIMTEEQRTESRQQYYQALSVTRRDFLKGVIAAGAVSGAGLGAMYFGYTKVARPVRVGIIGTGDEGNVLIGALNPDYVEVLGIADIRPSSIHRAFHGDYASDNALAARPGLMAKYDWKSEDEARKHVNVYDEANGGYPGLLDDPRIEGVIIALPLHLHARAAVDAMRKGKHVLTEKLMAHNVAQCKVMGRMSHEKGLHLATGHQRHYSILYDNAVNLIRWGVLGQIHHIRAQWHRGNLPGGDSWKPPLPGGERTADGKTYNPIAADLAKMLKDQERLDASIAQGKGVNRKEYERLAKRIAQWAAWDRDKTVSAEQFGYEEITLENNRVRSALEELVRWRLWDRTGGGLMAELGSHQLDAAGIFVSALRQDGKKAHPLTVHAVGGRHIFPVDRDADDHVYCMFEFPGPEYEPGFDVGYKDPVMIVPNPQTGIPPYRDDPNKKIVVTYSSINGNDFGGYGEIVMGTKGTLVLEREQEVLLKTKADVSTSIKVKDEQGGPTLDTTESGAGGAIAKAASSGPVSRGYTEEIEHWAWCIRNPDPENRPKCYPDVALSDAVIALATRVAVRNSEQGKSGYLEFDEAWYDLNNDATPDGSDVAAERQKLA